jgi:hypothetical protein
MLAICTPVQILPNCKHCLTKYGWSGPGIKPSLVVHPLLRKLYGVAPTTPPSWHGGSSGSRKHGLVYGLVSPSRIIQQAIVEPVVDGCSGLVSIGT